MMIKVISLPFLIIVLSGCAAVDQRETYGAGKAYAGIRADAHYLGHWSDADIPALQPLNIIDMPFSFIVDTICLPYDVLKK